MVGKRKSLFRNREASEAYNQLCNNIQSKFTECLLLNEESILLCEEGKITLSRLVLRLPSNSLSETMASRF